MLLFTALHFYVRSIILSLPKNYLTVYKKNMKKKEMLRRTAYGYIESINVTLTL